MLPGNSSLAPQRDLLLTQESILDTLLAEGSLAYAHEVFDFLLDGEFPDARKVLLVQEARAEIVALPRSPGEEDPDVSSRQQIMSLFRRYTLHRPNQPMRADKDYGRCDMRRGLWKWKTRTTRLAGMYYGGPCRFVVAHAGFARGLKRDGKAIIEQEKAFADTAAYRLMTIGLLNHSWKCKDPHDGEALPFDLD
jgi:hypothetical protein